MSLERQEQGPNLWGEEGTITVPIMHLFPRSSLTLSTYLFWIFLKKIKAGGVNPHTTLTNALPPRQAVNKSSSMFCRLY